MTYQLSSFACPGADGGTGATGFKGIIGYGGDTGATGATRVEYQVINRRAKRQTRCPGSRLSNQIVHR